MKVTKKGTGNASVKRDSVTATGKSDSKSSRKSKDHKCVDKSEQSDSRVGGTGSGVVSSEGQPGPATLSSKSPNVHGQKRKIADDVKSSKGVKRKSSDNIVPNTPSHVTKSGDAKKKKMKDQDNKTKETKSDTVRNNSKTPSKTPDVSNKSKPGQMATGAKKSSKSAPAKIKQSKAAKGKSVLKVSKKIFSSKTKKRALTPSNETPKSSIVNSRENSTSSQNKNDKAESATVKSVKKPNKNTKDTTSAKLKETNSDGKIKKRKLDKKTLAKRKLNKMKKLGFLTAPPRRSAALNASAIMNCIFDKPTAAAASVRLLKVKEEIPDSEEDDRITTSVQDPDTGDLKESNDADTDSDKGDEEEKESDLPVGGRRMASLNASAMLQATFGREERRARRDPMTIAIEASLRDMKDKEELERKSKSLVKVSEKLKPDPPKDKTYTAESPVKSCEKDKKSANTSFSSSIEGLSESDIKMKLIESAKIKSKISRQSFEEKVKKKVRRSNPDKSDEKVLNKSKSGNIISDASDQKSEVSKQCDIKEQTIKLELIPGEEKTSQLESVIRGKQNKKEIAVSAETEVKPEIEIFRKTSTHYQKVAPGSSCTIITGRPRAGTATSSSASSKLSTIRPVPVSQTQRPLYKIQSAPALTSHVTTPTATVQPTLLNIKGPVVGTVSPVRQPNYQAYPGLGSGGNVYGGGYVGGYYASSTPGYVGYNAYNVPGYNQPGYSGQQSTGGSGVRDQFSGSSGAFPGHGPQPYFIASASGQPFPGSLLPATTSTSYTSPVTGQSPGQGYLCGPYNYPYSGGRVIGPIIAIAPGSVPASPILNIPSAAAPPAQQQQTQQPPASRGAPDLPSVARDASRPQGKAVPIMSSSMSADPALFRNILPKNQDKKHTVTASVGGVRPMQVVGPIASSHGLVATVLPTLVTSCVPNTILTSTTSTTTSVTKIVTGASQEADKSVKRESDSPLVVNHVTVPQPHHQMKDFQSGFKSFVDGKFEKSRAKLENTVKGIQMKNTMSRTPPLLPARGLGGLSNNKSMAEIVSVPANSHGSGHNKKAPDCSPIVTVTVRSKSGTVEEDHHVIKRPKDWKEVVKAQSLPQKSLPVSSSKTIKPSTSPLVTPLRVPKPNFQFLQHDTPKLNQNKSSPKTVGSELPTFHIPHQSDSVSLSSETKVSLGHPGLPCGLQRMTSSLMQISKSPTKMALKEMKRIPSKAIGQPMSITAPVTPSSDPHTEAELPDRPPRLSPQISLSSAGASATSPILSRSRLQLKPATSPKLDIEQYLTVSNTNVSKLISDSSISSIKTRKSGLVIESKNQPAKDLKVKTPEVSTSPSAEKKAKRDSIPRKQSAPVLIPWSKRNKEPPKKSGGWSWKTKGFIGKVHLNNEDLPVERICYNTMRHEEGDEEVSVKDCILLASGNRKKDLPFIAKVTALWENPDDGEMMMSLLWFYRPEHTDIGRQAEDCGDEVFASKHRDFTSVACIEDKCFVMTFNEYCRYMRFSRMVDEGVSPPWNIVPERKEGYTRARLLPRCQVASDRVFLCRKVYDPRGRRMYKNPY